MTYIPETLRQQVIERAGECCEYCLIHQQDSLYAHEIDHIIPIKHRGTTAVHAPIIVGPCVWTSNGAFEI